MSLKPSQPSTLVITLGVGIIFWQKLNPEDLLQIVMNSLFQVIYRTVEEEKAIFLMCTDVENIGSIDKESGDKEKSSAKECSIMVPKDNR